MLTESTNSLTYQKLSKEEMEQRGILGRLVGVCADFISPTRNGRKYPEKLWENVFNDEIMKERIANGVCFGELGHPADREETDMEKICICMPEEPKKGPDGKLRAVFDILDTPNGRILKSLCDYGSTLGISSRGSGDLETGFDGQESVNPDTYNCEGFDVVLLPGVKDARLQYVTESLNLKKDNKTLREQLTESIKNETSDHQKIMKESLTALGINLTEDAYTNDELLDKFGTTDLDIINAGNEENVTLKESGDSEYHQLDVAFENSISFDDKDAASGRLMDMIEYLETHGQPYDLYENKTDNGCTLFYDGTLDILESWNNLANYLTEAKLTPEEKMDAWHAGNRRENIKACGDSKLILYRDICQQKGYDEQVDIIENEMLARGLIEILEDDTDSKIIAQMRANGRELWVMENKASKDFFNNFYGDEVWGFEQGMIDEDYYFIIPNTDKEAMKIANALIPIIQKQSLHEGYLDADRSVLKIIKSDKEYGKPYHVKDYIPDYSAIADGTVITARGLNPYHDVYATYEKISEDNWLETYFVNGEKKWSRNLTNHLLASELHNVELNESAINRETDDDIDEVSVADDNDMAMVNELQEALKLNKKLDEKIVDLQEKLSASYAKETKLEESIDSYKIKIAKLVNTSKENKALNEKLSKLENELKTSNEEVSSKKNTLHETMRRDATERKSLQESISNKDKEIAKLTEQLKNTQSEVKATTESVESLSEQLETARKDTKQIKEKYTTKLEQSNALIEKYKNIAKKAVDKYIDKQATILGVSSNEVKNRLPESYTFTDIDKVCESLREYKVNMNSLPFNTTKLNENVNLSVKNIDNRTLVKNVDDEISDTDLKLAERFIK